MNTREQITSTEQQVALGIQYLYALCQPKASDYDAQGICSVSVPTGKPYSEIMQLFPTHGKGGMTIHYFSPTYIPAPPIHYMLEQKIQSLCLAAQTLHPNRAAEIQAIAKKLIANINLTDITAENIAERSQELMRGFSQQTCLDLYQLLANKSKQEPAGFVAKLIEQSTHQRANPTSTLTFSEEGKRFSFDEVNSPITAHDRGVSKNTANVSVVYEGRDAATTAVVTSSIVKHAALPPIDEISSYRVRDLYETDMDVIIATCNHIEEIARTMAALRRPEGSKDPMTIDWTYQLLTTNAFNVEKQASTYGYTINAMNLMQGVNVGEGVTLNMHVFNAGINALANWNLGQKTDTQRRENRKAYLNLNDAFSAFIRDLPAEHYNDKKFIYTYLTDKTDNRKELDIHYAKLRAELVKNAQDFQKLRKLYCDPNQSKANRKNTREVMSDCLELARKINDDIRHVTYQLENEQKALWQTHRKTINNQIGTRRKELSSLLTEGGPDAEEATKQILALSAACYKSYMDEMYYTGVYRQPEKAALFNAYMSAFQRLIGLSASTGCKSANDRTYVARLVLAAMEGRDLNTQPLPYGSNAADLTKLKEELAKIAMSNTAMFTPINDTNGGTPKVDARKFSILSLVPGIDAVSKLGRYAAHKMQSSKMIKAIAKVIQNAVKIVAKSFVTTAGMFSKTAPAPVKRRHARISDAVHIRRAQNRV